MGTAGCHSGAGVKRAEAVTRVKETFVEKQSVYNNIGGRLLKKTMSLGLRSAFTLSHSLGI